MSSDVTLPKIMMRKLMTMQPIQNIADYADPTIAEPLPKVRTRKRITMQAPSGAVYSGLIEDEVMEDEPFDNEQTEAIQDYEGIE
jgi:hypothetical protein